MDASPLAVSLRVSNPAVVLEGRLSVSNGLASPDHLGPLGPRTLLHAKRDGQVLFVFADGLSGAELTLSETCGEPGDVFLFSGDSESTTDERRGQILFVYGEDNLFVEPFDRGFKRRRYQRVGRVSPTSDLHRLGEHVWRRGAVEIDWQLA